MILSIFIRHSFFPLILTHSLWHTSFPDTLLKLAEYGDEDDEEIPERSIEMPKSNPTTNSTPKPFWAV